jgi:hypothetical protein
MITGDEAVETLIEVNKGQYAPTASSTTVKEFTPSYIKTDPPFVRDTIIIARIGSA